MGKNYKKIIVFSIFTILLLFLAYYINIAKNCDNTVAYYKNMATSSTDKTKTEEKWSIFHDEKYGFSIGYQSGLDVNTVYNHKMILSSDNKNYQIINGGVNFSLGGGPGVSVEIFDDSPYSSLEEWLSAKNQEKLLSHYVIDSKQAVEGYPAISIKEVGNDGMGQAEYNYTQMTAFFRNKQLFVIFTGDNNTRDKILGSFKFDK